MEIYLDELRKNPTVFKVLSDHTWGTAFLNLKKGQKFVIYYDLKEWNSTYDIKATEILYEINDLIYKKKSYHRATNVSWVQEPFPTDTYFLYSFIKSAIVYSHTYSNEIDQNLKELTNLFLTYKEKDFIASKSRIKIKETASQEVNSDISFSTALSNIFKYNKKPIQGIKMVYDLLNQYTLYKFNTSIYGEILSHFVKAIRNPNGGLIPETDGAMRYMIIGERVAKNDPDLIKAKELLRSLNSTKDIFYETGWYFSNLDSKWRKNISDESFGFKHEAISNSGNDYGVVPKNMTGGIQELRNTAINLAVSDTSMLDLVKNGYNVRISDYIVFPEIFKLYPDLQNVYSFFFISDQFQQMDIHSCYFSDETPMSLVLISHELYNDIGYIALHEMQHYIQRYEGFANGGNLYLADLISSIGGGGVRDFLLSLDAIKKEFKKVASLISVLDYNELLNRIQSTTFSSYQIRYKQRFVAVDSYLTSYIAHFTKFVQSPEAINYYAADIITYLIEMYALVQETNPVIREFIEKNIGIGYMKIFDDALQRNIKAVQREQGLVQKGWTAFDLYNLSFETYKALGGELESRFTQQTTKVPTELKGYLNFLTSEIVDADKITVINNEILVNKKDIVGGIELTKENKYIIHLFNNIDDSVVLLHETGHLVYDICLKNPELIDNVADGISEASDFGFDDSEEFFCEAFVDFIHRKNIDDKLTEDMNGIREIKNITTFDNVFNYVMYSEKIKIDEERLLSMIEFVKMI